MTEELRTEVSVQEIRKAESYDAYISYLEKQGVNTHKAFHTEKHPTNAAIYVIVQKTD